MASVEVTSKLPGLVREAWARAQASGALLYYPTQVAIVPVGSIPFQLRFSPALASKPKNPQPKTNNSNNSSKPFNPFENPDPALLVSSSADGKEEDPAAREVVDAVVGPNHNLVLNKFAIVAEHFLVITRSFEPQTHLLRQDDLAAAYACIKAYARRGGENDGGLFAFFNSGPHSGASQPHRHLQLLPISRMREGLEKEGEGEGDSRSWSPLIDLLLPSVQSATTPSPPEPPFAIFTAPISETTTDDKKTLHDIYVRLYRQAVNAYSSSSSSSPSPSPLKEGGESQISYNLAMTTTTMAICPRVAEGGEIYVSSSSPSPSSSSEKEKKKIGYAGLNGTVLGGTALVKSEAEWEALRREPILLQGVLEGIGITSSPSLGKKSENL